MKKIFLYISSDIRRIIGLYLWSLFVASFLLSLFEWISFWDAYWLSCISALTIGYWDISAATTAGKIITVIFWHFWIFIIAPMIVANILWSIMEDRDAFTHEEQEEIKGNLKENNLLLKELLWKK